MITMTNAQAALAAAATVTPNSGAPSVSAILSRATAFKTWLDENESREGTPS